MEIHDVPDRVFKIIIIQIFTAREKRMEDNRDPKRRDRKQNISIQTEITQ